MTSETPGLAMMPWFHRDFLASTQGWSAAESGVYFLLLGAQWEMGPLPNEPTQLAAIARSTLKDFKAIWQRKVGRKFRVTTAGLVNGRLEEHRREAIRRREQHRKGAQKTNSRRWGASLSESLSESLSGSPPSPSPSLQDSSKEGEVSGEGVRTGSGDRETDGDWGAT